ncbi:hypothetical protein AAZX31_15G009200 [Glycine max]
MSKREWSSIRTKTNKTYPLPRVPSPPIDNRQGVQFLPKLLSSKPIQCQSLLVETIQFQTLLRTCTYVITRTCLTAPNVVTLVLATCLIPSMNQCVYATAGISCFPISIAPCIIMFYS